MMMRRSRSPFQVTRDEPLPGYQLELTIRNIKHLRWEHEASGQGDFSGLSDESKDIVSQCKWLEAKYEIKIDKTNELKNAYSQLEKDKDNLKKENNDLKKEIEGLKTQNAELKDEVTGEKIKLVRKQNAALKMRLEESGVHTFLEHNSAQMSTEDQKDVAGGDSRRETKDSTKQPGPAESTKTNKRGRESDDATADGSALKKNKQ